MFTFLKSLVDAFAVPTLAARELAYLNQSASAYDLECRQARVEHGLFRHMEFSH